MKRFQFLKSMYPTVYIRTLLYLGIVLAGLVTHRAGERAVRVSVALAGRAGGEVPPPSRLRAHLRWLPTVLVLKEKNRT